MTFSKKYPAFWATVALVLTAIGAFGQSGVYVPKKGKIFFKEGTATIFSDVTNEGKVGIGKNAVVNFSGTTWTNAAGSALAVDTTAIGTPQGGWLVFNGTSKQYLEAGYNAAMSDGPIFHNIKLQNQSGLQLLGSSAKVARELRFVAGRLYLNNQVFVVGHYNPGIITGYDSARFFVTGSRAGGGLLVRENISSLQDWITFPVGTADGAYAPAALRSKTAAGDDYSVAVFDTVRRNLFNGGTLADEGVGKVWQVGKRFAPGQGEVELQLQHLLADEGRLFAANRARSYVSQYEGGRWDTSFLQMPPTPGTLTSGTVLVNSGLNVRPASGPFQSASYFTKFVAVSGPLLRTNLIFTGYRVSADLVKLNWQTNPEINVKKFVVERRFSNETTFRSIDTVASKAANGYSTYFLNYALDDPNSYGGVTFYRLKIFNYSDSSYYSNVIGVSGVSFQKITLWPNPTPDKFTVILYGHIAKYVVVHNAAGQLMWQEDVKGRSVIPMSGYAWASGVYFVSVIGNDGRVLQTEKLLIVR